ncbi:hypothetical protein [Streptomyces sp. NPDC057877]|uniref:hypothetical protein n=1 Tax=Streptomyces sp. NPDC057877 TaxID=3346269 RepID=UPI0036C7E3F8
MGERLSGGGVSGRRGAAADPWWAERDGALEALLTTALREGRIDADAEQRAVAAFRTARDAGAHRARARTRRRDDWRPRAHRRAGRSLKATLAVVLGSLTLGGVAVAAIGSAGSTSDDAGKARTRPETSTLSPKTPTQGSAPTGPSAATTSPDGPSTAQDTEAQCRAYEQVAGRGQALDATAWQRLVAAAGGEEKVDAFCAARDLQPTPSARPTTPPARPDGVDASDNADKGNGKQ